MSETQFKASIANHLKTIRKEKGLSLDATAKLTGVSKAMLGQIERGESSPTIATLWKIASGLETSYSAFFAHDCAPFSDDEAFPNDPNMRVKTLFPFSAETGFEVFEITLENHHQQDSSAHEHGVIEHILVLSGELELYVDNQWYQLSAGDRQRFYADQAHAYRAKTAQVIFQDIISYPRKTYEQ
ncbi:helix-turn-helix domain-containing protein [Vibrio sp. WXL103]|uniref:helix-turn-helix domain-containing protein n=1 Tax=Vibrio sp. WXL103 TaxID=3450710 RepID=UPI003EC68751